MKKYTNGDLEKVVMDVLDGKPIPDDLVEQGFSIETKSFGGKDMAGNDANGEQAAGKPDYVTSDQMAETRAQLGGLSKEVAELKSQYATLQKKAESADAEKEEKKKETDAEKKSLGDFEVQLKAVAQIGADVDALRKENVELKALVAAHEKVMNEPQFKARSDSMKIALSNAQKQASDPNVGPMDLL